MLHQPNWDVRFGMIKIVHKNTNEKQLRLNQSTFKKLGVLPRAVPFFSAVDFHPDWFLPCFWVGMGQTRGVSTKPHRPTELQ